MKTLYIGVMTGNSMDAADAVLMSFADNKKNTATVENAASVPIDAPLADTLRHLAQSASIETTTVLAAQNALTDTCAAAVKKLNAPTATVRAIGCHGQTIAHRPATAATWQLFNGARMAEQTQIDVICDFRSRDIASGGQGAPFAPFFHQYFFAAHAPCDIINIGGIANITHIDSTGAIAAGYDSGPGMLLLDAWYRRQGNNGFDKNGAFAASGNVDTPLLQQLLTLPYFSRPHPKSCGREEFSLAQLPASIHNLAAADVQATLLALSAHSIAAAVRATEHVFLCGGGSRNTALVAQLQNLLATAPQLTDTLGIAVEQIEAAAFAYLAKCHIERTPLAAANITGGQTRIAGACYPYQ